MPQDPYAQFGAPVQPPAKADPYADFGAPVSAPVANTPPPVKVPPAAKTQPDDSSMLLGKDVNGPNPYKLDSYGDATLHGLWGLGQGVAQGINGGINLIKTAARAYNDPHADVGDAAFPEPKIEQVPGAIKDINNSPDPLGTYATVAGDTAAQGGGQLGTMLAAHKIGSAVPETLKSMMPAEPEANIVKNTYSEPGDHLAASLRSNTKVDVPAEAKIAAPAIEEGLNDRGISTKDFKGRNGPAALQAGIDNAIDIHEARAKSVIDPIRGEAVDPQVFAKNPELASRFLDKEGNLKKGLTYGDLDAERIKMNKELRTSNFYSKPPSGQYAVGDPLANLHDAANQARDLVYDKAGQTTGVDLRPLKHTESSLIKLGDLAETTKNTLSAKGAQHAVTSLPKKIQGTIQGALSVKANPINAFSIPEKSGLFDPTNEFNGHMQKAFPSLKAAAADRTVPFTNYKLNLTPSGTMPPPMQQILNLSGGENVPGQDLKLTPSGDMPPALQRVLGFENPGVPSPLYPGVKK